MTAAAQQALRRTMEVYSSSTRFALACNQSTKIIEPIQSRCAVLRYTRLSDAEVLLRLQQVCSLEGVDYDASGLEAVIFTAEGDMRNALNALQSTVSGFGRVTSENVFKVGLSSLRVGASFGYNYGFYYFSCLACRCAMCPTRTS